MSRRVTISSSVATASAARGFNRRLLLQSAAAGGLVAAGPWYVRDALSSSGEVSWFTWEDYAPKKLVDRFEKDTGIKLKVTTFSSNEEQLNKLRAARGEGFDMCAPSVAWVGAHVAAGNLQPVDLSKVTKLSAMAKSFQRLPEEVGAVVGGKHYCVAYDWGSEAMAFNTQKVKLAWPTASFGDLWDPQHKGKMLCRPRSIMLGTGLWMEGKGELPPGTMKKAYHDQAAFELGYGKAMEYTIKNKPQIGKFWTSTAETQAGFLQEGMVIGMTWDGPINTMRNEGNPVQYLAPKEGALAWSDTIAITKGAKNIAQIYAFIDWALNPEVGGLMADETGYNSVVIGAEKHTKPNFTKNFNDAYPGDAIERLWFQGEEQPWFIAKRQEFANKIQAA
jgi:spermidine/putrescine transport system substrate-binding protein